MELATLKEFATGIFRCNVVEHHSQHFITIAEWLRRVAFNVSLPCVCFLLSSLNIEDSLVCKVITHPSSKFLAYLIRAGVFISKEYDNSSLRYSKLDINATSKFFVKKYTVLGLDIAELLEFLEILPVVDD